jgi:hypothetical protein
MTHGLADQTNELDPSQRNDQQWHYVLIAEFVVRERYSENVRCSDRRSSCNLRLASGA